MDLKNQSGQLIIEAVLLMIVGIGVCFFLIKGLKKMDFIGSVTVKPWANISGMVECGVWTECGISKKSIGHPQNRIVSQRPQGRYHSE